MGKGVAIEWPSDEELLALTCHGSVNKAAAALGRNESTLRHRLVKQGLLDEFKARCREGVTPDLPVAADAPVSREEMLAQEVRELRQALTRDRKGEVARERILSAYEQALADIPFPDRSTITRTAKPPSAPGKDAHHRQMVLLSDFHGGEVVEAEVVDNLNAYDWQIMEARVDELVDGLLSHKRNSPALAGLDVAVIGDMCSGANHEELKVSNQYPLAVQGVKIGYLLGRTIERLLPHYPDLRVVSVEGNHPRLERKPAAKSPENNMDWVAGIIAAEYLRPHNVPWIHGRGSVLHTIAGRTCYIWHGDGIRSSMPGVPWGGVMRRVNELARQSRQPIDHFILGHFHQACIVQSGRIIMNGSLKGVDEWCRKQFGGGDPPTQLLLTFDEKRQRLTDVKYLTPTAGLPA